MGVWALSVHSPPCNTGPSQLTSIPSMIIQVLMNAPLRPLTYVDLLMSMAMILIGRREWVTHRAEELGQIQTTQPSASVSISTTGADSGTFYTFLGPIQVN